MRQLLASVSLVLLATPGAAGAAGTYAQLLQLAQEWRQFERPAKREISGETIYDVRQECLLEVVLGRGDRWELSGKDWCAWNAAFGPRGRDGWPLPLLDGATGKIDRDAIEHWKKYDLRLVLQSNWKTLGPKLRGKLHIWVGEADDYYLNNAVHLLDSFLTRAKPAYEGKITYGAGRGHSWKGLSEKEMMKEMAKAMMATSTVPIMASSMPIWLRPGSHWFCVKKCSP